MMVERGASRDVDRVIALFGREYLWRLEDGVLVLIPFTWQFNKRTRIARGIRPWFDKGPW